MKMCNKTNNNNDNSPIKQENDKNRGRQQVEINTAEIIRHSQEPTNSLSKPRPSEDGE